MRAGVALLALTACGGEDASESKTASASLAALAMSGITGNVTFTAGIGNVAITGSVMGLAPSSQHGFHIHELGSCADMVDATTNMSVVGGAAGGHWNPAMHMHGAPEGMTHLGDLGNIVADATGVAMINITKAGLTIADGSMTDVVGHALIVHANPDDLVSQPVGMAGGRAACGVIQ
jgi:Cu-Zn family superoxide dismutase